MEDFDSDMSYLGFGPEDFGGSDYDYEESPSRQYLAQIKLSPPRKKQFSPVSGRNTYDPKKVKETWFNSDNDILIESLPELLEIANTPQFGEDRRGAETLVEWLMCEAFDSKYDKERSRCLHLAAMIISRVKGDL